MDTKTKRNLMYGGIALVVVIVLVVGYMMMGKKTTSSGNTTTSSGNTTTSIMKKAPTTTVLAGNVLPTVGSNIRLKYPNGYVTPTGALSKSAQDALVFTVGSDQTIIGNTTQVRPAVSLSKIIIAGVTYNPVLVTDGTYTIAVIQDGYGFFDDTTTVSGYGISGYNQSTATDVSNALEGYPLYRVQVEVINA